MGKDAPYLHNDRRRRAVHEVFYQEVTYADDLNAYHSGPRGLPIYTYTYTYQEKVQQIVPKMYKTCTKLDKQMSPIHTFIPEPVYPVCRYGPL